MGSRGDNTGTRPHGRPAIARRSCDQCRTRKIGCDRGSPCSNCVTARVDCTHSAVAANTTLPRQRVLISAQYEQKIDDIAKGIDGINGLLRSLNLPSPDSRQSGNVPISSSSRTTDPRENGDVPTRATANDPKTGHSAHLIEFVKSVVADLGTRNIQGQWGILTSLHELLGILEDRSAAKELSLPKLKPAKHMVDSPMPPQEAVIAVLRWAKAHESFARMQWISRILPLARFTEICRKVYFAVDDYDEIDYIIANSYLSYIFGEQVAVSGHHGYKRYSDLCRVNLHQALVRLPLLLPPTMEAVAALVLGAMNAIEDSKGILAWNYVSAALNICLTLGFHRVLPNKEKELSLQTAQQSLFWIVYKIEKGLSLQLGRSSCIPDREITIPFDQSHKSRLGKLQGEVYEQLYSPNSLSQASDNDRTQRAEALAAQLRCLINETHIQISDCANQPEGSEPDELKPLWLQCDLVCQASLLALILWAMPSARSFSTGTSENCVAVARFVFDTHQKCMASIHSYKKDPFMLQRYINWAVLHVPFVAFSVLFTRAVQLLDTDELARLDRFAATLEPEETSTETQSITHPYHLYRILCQTARLYIEANAPYTTPESILTRDVPQPSGDMDFIQFGTGFPEPGKDASLERDGVVSYGLNDWFYGNQQLMNLLEEDVTF